MIRFITYLFSLFFSLSSSLAQSTCPCCTLDHQQFDFWIGDWVVFDTLGAQVGENQVVHLEDKCIISEHWKGSTGSTGRSYNYFNTTDSTWNQVWIDNSGGHLELKGKATSNKMTLKSGLLPGKKVDWYYNQITWTANEDNTVTQLWEVFDKKDQLLTIVFKGIYRKRQE